MANEPRLPPLDTLIYLDAAMRHLNFRSAADELHVTQSAVSQRIKSLEDALGVKLFDRLSHGIRPTEAARLFFFEMRPALARIRRATSRIATRGNQRPAGRGRRLSIDMLPALATTRFVPALGRFFERFPDVELRLTTSPALSDPGRDGFDCCIRYGDGEWPGVNSTKLIDEMVWPVCSPSLLNGQSTQMKLTELVRLPLIHDLMPLGWTEWFSVLGSPEQALSGLVFSDSANALRAAAEGAGVALGRSVLAAPELASGRLIGFLQYGIRSPFAYWLVRPPGRPDGLVDMFADWFVDELSHGSIEEER